MKRFIKYSNEHVHVLECESRHGGLYLVNERCLLSRNWNRCTAREIPKDVDISGDAGIDVADEEDFVWYDGEKWHQAKDIPEENKP